MSDPEPDSPAPATGSAKRTGNSVLCPVCERLNPLGLDKCDRCGGELFAACRHCGARNQRTTTRCPSCGRRQDTAKRKSKTTLWHSPLFWTVVVAAVGILLALLLLFWLGGGKLPRI